MCIHHDPGETFRLDPTTHRQTDREGQGQRDRDRETGSDWKVKKQNKHKGYTMYGQV